MERKISGGFMAAPLLIKLSPAQTAFKMTHSFVTISSRQFLRFFPETQLKNGFRSAGMAQLKNGFQTGGMPMDFILPHAFDMQ